MSNNTEVALEDITDDGFSAGHTGFMLVCTSLVMLMTPGLAFFLWWFGFKKERALNHVSEFCVYGSN